MTAVVTIRRSAAPRKAFGGHGVPAVPRDPYHTAAAFTYRSLCSPKRLAYAWQINVSTARKYGRGDVVGSLTRLAWEIALLERAGIDTRPMRAFLARVAQHNRLEVGAS